MAYLTTKNLLLYWILKRLKKGGSAMAIAIGLIIRDLDALGLGKWNEASLKKIPVKRT